MVTLVALHFPANGEAAEPDPGAEGLALTLKMAEACSLTVEPALLRWLDQMAQYAQYDAPVATEAEAEMQRQFETKGRINACLELRSHLHNEGWLK